MRGNGDFGGSWYPIGNVVFCFGEALSSGALKYSPGFVGVFRIQCLLLIVLYSLLARILVDVSRKNFVSHQRVMDRCRLAVRQACVQILVPHKASQATGKLIEPPFPYLYIYCIHCASRPSCLQPFPRSPLLLALLKVNSFPDEFPGLPVKLDF